MSANAAPIADLQEKIDRIAGAHRSTRPRLPFGVPEIDRRIHSGLAFGSTHEIAGGGSDTVNGATAASFTAGVAARTKGPVFWCLVNDDLFAPALTEAGLDVHRVTFVQSTDEDGVMESAEEILNHGGIAVMVAELVRLLLWCHHDRALSKELF